MRFIITLLFLAVTCFCQQQNSTNATLDVFRFGANSLSCSSTNAPYCLYVPPGVDGICARFYSFSTSRLQLWGALGAPIPGISIISGGSIDIDVNNGLVRILDMPNHILGTFTLCVGSFGIYPQLDFSLQGIVIHPTFPFGYILTAATYVYR